MPSDAMNAVIELLRSREESDDLAERRRGTDELASFDPLPDDVRVEPVDAGVPAEIVAAPGADPDAWILYTHGGAYTAGSLTSHRAHVARLSRATGATVLQVDYRLAPEHPHPAAVEDAVGAYRWLLGTKGVDPGRVVLCGDSAGGGLALATLVALRDAGDPQPAGGALISPWTDLTIESATYDSRADADPMCSRQSLTPSAQQYLGGADPRTPTASPLHADLRGLPPLLVHVGDAEVLLDDSVELGRRAQAAGVDCTVEVTPEAIHVWHVLAGFGVPESLEALERLAAWIRERLKL